MLMYGGRRAGSDHGGGLLARRAMRVDPMAALQVE
jgi:hypothetical protein